MKRASFLGKLCLLSLWAFCNALHVVLHDPCRRQNHFPFQISSESALAVKFATTELLTTTGLPWCIHGRSATLTLNPMPLSFCWAHFTNMPWNVTRHWHGSGKKKKSFNLLSGAPRNNQAQRNNTTVGFGVKPAHLPAWYFVTVALSYR